MFITFEGPEGSGKTTHAQLLKEFLKTRGLAVDLTREPGGTPIGENIREILLDPSHSQMNDKTELLLYEAARAQHVAERIEPALAAGKIVICDRFADATTVYQGVARGLGLGIVKKLNSFATGKISPDLTFIMDISTEEGLKKARDSSQAKWNQESGDRIEQENNSFHEKVRKNYRKLAADNPDRCFLLELTKPIETIQAEIQTITLQELKKIED